MRSGVWLLARSYSARFRFLSSTKEGSGSVRRFGAALVVFLVLGVFLEDFRAVFFWFFEEFPALADSGMGNLNSKVPPTACVCGVADDAEFPCFAKEGSSLCSWGYPSCVSWVRTLVRFISVAVGRVVLTSSIRATWLQDVMDGLTCPELARDGCWFAALASWTWSLLSLISGKQRMADAVGAFACRHRGALSAGYLIHGLLCWVAAWMMDRGGCGSCWWDDVRCRVVFQPCALRHGPPQGSLLCHHSSRIVQRRVPCSSENTSLNAPSSSTRIPVAFSVNRACQPAAAVLFLTAQTCEVNSMFSCASAAFVCQ